MKREGKENDKIQRKEEKESRHRKKKRRTVEKKTNKEEEIQCQSDDEYHSQVENNIQHKIITIIVNAVKLSITTNAKFCKKNKQMLKICETNKN